MKNIPFDKYLGPRMSREMAMKRIQRVIREELTDIERDVLLAYYIQEKKLPQIARERNVNKSSTARALHRAEQKLKRYLKY